MNSSSVSLKGCRFRVGCCISHHQSLCLLLCSLRTRPLDGATNVYWLAITTILLFPPSFLKRLASRHARLVTEFRHTSRLLIFDEILLCLFEEPPAPLDDGGGG